MLIIKLIIGLLVIVLGVVIIMVIRSRAKG